MRHSDTVLLSNKSDFDKRYFHDVETLRTLIASWREDGKRIVLTSGSWDMIHEGHAMYLEQARSHGDVLVVGVDSDAKIRARKGPERPIVPERERVHMLTHLRSVDVVFLKQLERSKWELIKAVRPDTLVATRETYSNDQIEELEDKYCGEVVVLDPMGTTSTSARLRLVQMGLATKLTNSLAKELPGIIQNIINSSVAAETRNSPTNPLWPKE